MIDTSNRNFNRADFTKFVNADLTRSRWVDADTFDRLYNIEGALVHDAEGFADLDQTEDGLKILVELTDEAWNLACKMGS